MILTHMVFFDFFPGASEGETPPAPAFVPRSRTAIGVGVGIGICLTLFLLPRIF